MRSKQLVRVGLIAIPLLATALIGSSAETTDKAAVAATNAGSSADADKAWAEVLAAAKPPAPDHNLNDDEREKFNQEMRQKLLTAIQKVKDFRAAFPNAKTEDAAKLEKALTGNAYQLGLLNPVEKPKSSKSDEEMMKQCAEMQQKLQKAKSDLFKRAMAKESQGFDAVLEEFDKGLRQLAQDFPDDPSLGRQVQMFSGTRGMLTQMGMMGKPPEIKFTSLDGKQIDLAKLKGKVVLVDFWATWCGPCVGEVPHVRAAYEKLHDKGFEILSISLDDNKDTLRKFVAAKNMTWPQGFNPEVSLAEKYGITSIPTMWLVDKNGMLRDQEARFGLEEKVEKLLAE